MPEPDILVSEVGPRDGLQNIDAVLPTEAKKRWIQSEAEAGVTEIEVGSFVPAKYMPQLADTQELVSFARAIKGLSVAVLVPNFYGAKAAVEAQADKMSIPFSVSENEKMLQQAGFHDVELILKWFNFGTFLAYAK